MSLFQSVSTDLLHELKAFGDVASQQRARLEVSQSQWNFCTDLCNFAVSCSWFTGWLECILNVPHFHTYQEIQTTMTALAKAREHMRQERENFSLEAAEMEKALKEAEALL